MQLLSPPLLIGVTATTPWIKYPVDKLVENPEAQHVVFFLAAVILLAQVFQITGLWLASKAVSRTEMATMGNAIKVWLLQLILVMGLIVGLAILVAVTGAEQNSIQALAIIGGGLLLGIVLLYLVPMKVYAIGFWRAFALLLLAGVIQSTGLYGVQVAAMTFYFTPEQLAALKDIPNTNPEDRQRMTERLLGLPSTDVIDLLLTKAQHPPGVRLPQAQREAAVNVLQAKLEERRRALPPGDAKAAADFQAKLDRYLRLLAEVKAERAAPQVPGAPAH